MNNKEKQSDRSAKQIVEEMLLLWEELNTRESAPKITGGDIQELAVEVLGKCGCVNKTHSDPFGPVTDY